ncbi:hypothetical protein HDK77DRAFT_194657 [Phyllosticta capitalensis]
MVAALRTSCPATPRLDIAKIQSQKNQIDRCCWMSTFLDRKRSCLQHRPGVQKRKGRRLVKTSRHKYHTKQTPSLIHQNSSNIHFCPKRLEIHRHSVCAIDKSLSLWLRTNLLSLTWISTSFIMTTTEGELAALMRLMDDMEDSLRDMQDDYRVMRDDLEEFLLTGSDSPSTNASTSSSAASTPERAGQKKGEKSAEQQSWTGEDGQKTLSLRVSRSPTLWCISRVLIAFHRDAKDLESCSKTTEIHKGRCQFLTFTQVGSVF